jgi:hypothetical protein
MDTQDLLEMACIVIKSLNGRIGYKALLDAGYTQDEIQELLDFCNG